MKFALTATAVDNSMDASEKSGILDMLGDFVDAKLNDLSGLADDAWDFVKNNKKDLLHTTLDFVGMMPGVGNVADILNAALYASEGDIFNSVMCLTSSIPVLGNLSTTAKYTTKTLDTSLSFLKNTGKVDNLLDGKKLLKDSDGLLTKLFKKADEVPVEDIPRNSSANVPKSLLQGEANTRVYLGIKDGEFDYVGIAKDIGRRQKQHGDRFETLREITEEPLTRRQARAIEQVMIEKHPEFSNKINSISPNRDWYNDAKDWGTSWLEEHGFL